MKTEKTCSSCIHAASKNRYVNTVPSIHTCMNQQGDYYLEDRAWSHVCIMWSLMPEDIFSNLEYF